MGDGVDTVIPLQDCEDTSLPEQGFECAEGEGSTPATVAEVLCQLDGRLERLFQRMADQLSEAQTEQLLKMVRQLVDFKTTIGRVLDMQGEILDSLHSLTVQAQAVEPPANLPPIGSPLLAKALAKKRPRSAGKGQGSKGPKIPLSFLVREFSTWRWSLDFESGRLHTRCALELRTALCFFLAAFPLAPGSLPVACTAGAMSAQFSEGSWSEETSALSIAPMDAAEFPIEGESAAGTLHVIQNGAALQAMTQVFVEQHNALARW
eukprot:590749-Amphidinium_carterae.1